MAAQTPLAAVRIAICVGAPRNRRPPYDWSGPACLGRGSPVANRCRAGSWLIRLTKFADGKKFYVSNCTVCQGADGTGKMGPTLDVVYKQVLTDPGMFSIIYHGASSAMQSFHRRGMKQDEVLRIIAYVRTLDK
ncbi:MAG: hypothetical protein C5B58_00220 [Acidobacteria bacterium]|nr:MAG: hypothetical protein C5B58_00220 [Acidobacteriota bacterium]